MIITQITELTKQKSKVFLDEEFAFVLYKGELRNYKMKQGEELPEETYCMIMQKVLPKRAKLRCMNLLKNKDYTRHELELKLKQGLYPPEAIEEAIAYVISYHYVDDVRYTNAYIDYARHSKSKKQIELALMKKGIPKEMIKAAFEEIDEEDSTLQEEALIRKFLVKKHYINETATPIERRKIIGSLYRKGFSLDNIYKVVGETE